MLSLKLVVVSFLCNKIIDQKGYLWWQSPRNGNAFRSWWARNTKVGNGIGTISIKPTIIYNIIPFFTLFMPKSEAQLKKKNCDATALEVTSSIPAGSFTIYKFIDEVFYLSKNTFWKVFMVMWNTKSIFNRW